MTKSAIKTFCGRVLTVTVKSFSSTCMLMCFYTLIIYQRFDWKKWHTCLCFQCHNMQVSFCVTQMLHCQILWIQRYNNLPSHLKTIKWLVKTEKALRWNLFVVSWSLEHLTYLLWLALLHFHLSLSVFPQLSLPGIQLDPGHPGSWRGPLCLCDGDAVQGKFQWPRHFTPSDTGRGGQLGAANWWAEGQAVLGLWNLILWETFHKNFTS